MSGQANPSQAKPIQGESNICTNWSFVWQSKQIPSNIMLIFAQFSTHAHAHGCWPFALIEGLVQAL